MEFMDPPLDLPMPMPPSKQYTMQYRVISLRIIHDRICSIYDENVTVVCAK